MVVEHHHTLSYIEFGVTDLQVTRAFYELAFGWEFNDYGPNYTGIKSVDGDSEVGGRRFEFTDPSGNRLGVYAAR